MCNLFKVKQQPSVCMQVLVSIEPSVLLDFIDPTGMRCIASTIELGQVLHRAEQGTPAQSDSFLATAGSRTYLLSSSPRTC